MDGAPDAGLQNDATSRVEAYASAPGPVLDAFFDSVPMAMGVVEVGGGHVVHRAANRLAAVLYGWDEAEVVGQSLRALGLPPAEIARWTGAFEACRAAREPVRFETVLPWGADSESEGARHLSVVVHMVDAGRPLFSYAIEDVTERRRVERDLQLLQTAMDATTVAVLITDAALDAPGPEIVYVNDGFAQMTGYSVEEALGMTPRVLQGPKTDRAVLDRLRRRLVAGERFRGETVNYRKDGTEYDLEWTVAPVRDAVGRITHYVSSQRDVTERRRLEHAVLEVALREQERIAQDLHDGVGQVLTGVAYMVHALREQLARDGPTERVAAVTRLGDLVSDVLAQTRAIAHGLFPVKVEGDGLALALGRLADTSSEAYGIECRFVLEGPLPVASAERAGHLYRIAQEAISNAVRHGRARTVLLALSVLSDGEAALTIQDDGVGIDDDALEAGGGMGLQSMRVRARRVGGTLEVEPWREGGTIVRCRFSP